MDVSAFGWQDLSRALSQGNDWKYSENCGAIMLEKAVSLLYGSRLSAGGCALSIGTLADAE